jgi:hypothetical protein
MKGTAANEPQVPGALGSKPTKQKVEMNKEIFLII